MQKRILLKISLWVPPFVWAFLIFSLSSIPLPNVSGTYWGDFVFKKLAHIFFYGTLAVLIYRALVGEGFSKKRAIIWAIGLSVCYGITDEYHQSFTAGREPRIRDIFIDGVGASLFMLVLYKFGYKYKKILSLFGLY